MLRALALVLTVLTGFSALVYEVAWQRYLAALLGSHSEATAAVLAIFLGALSLGYAIFGGVTRRLVERALEEDRPAGLLYTYGAVEATIGAYALMFPWIFAGVQRLSLWLPAGSAGLSFAIDVGLSALLLGPPVLLMGATIPLLTQGLSRDLGDSTRFHALVYATNTAGSFAGALCAGFLLVPRLGLQGSLIAMSAVNLLAGAALAALGTRERAPVRREVVAEAEGPPAGFAGFIAVALLSGFAAMTLQMIMNRIGALTLGASNFTFSMVVAIFVLSIALGSFAVAALRSVPVQLLPLSQWVLVVYLLALYPFVDDAPYWAHRLRTGFSDDAFIGYHLALFAAGLAVFLVPLGISGATLPLLFHQLRRQVGQLGQLAGRLYSWNTAGSLLGALVGGHLILHWLDLHDSYRLALVALVAGAALLSRAMLRRGGLLAGVATLASLVALTALPQWSQKQLSAGLFRVRADTYGASEGPRHFWKRFRSSWPEDYVAFYDDDPAMSIAVYRRPTAGALQTSLINNGKPDSAIPADDVTTGLLGLLPALLAERRERAFVVGYGTGMTVGRLNALDDVREVVVAEISSAVMDAAAEFEAVNGNVLADTKTRVVRSDAYRALLRSADRYDLIVSEPSNPWVTGVEMLYSVDFYRAAKSRLERDGIFVQWFHTYEMDEATVALVLQTFRSIFRANAIWYGRGPDLLILGFREDDFQLDLADIEARWARPDFVEEFRKIGFTSLPQLLAHELVPLGVLRRAHLPVTLHTIAHPYLSYRASFAFYRGANAALPDLLSPDGIAVGRRNALLPQYRAKHGLTVRARAKVLSETCLYRLEPCAALLAEWTSQEPGSERLQQILGEARRSRDHREIAAPELQETLLLLFSGPDGSTAPVDYDRAVEAERLYRRFYHHAAPFPEGAMPRLWQACAADPRCLARLRSPDGTPGA
jgi:predicted membrane-bound spermidine synthase